MLKNIISLILVVGLAASVSGCGKKLTKFEKQAKGREKAYKIVEGMRKLEKNLGSAAVTQPPAEERPAGTAE